MSTKLYDTVTRIAEQRNISLRKIAEQMGVNHSQVSRTLHRKIPVSWQWLKQMCEVLKCSQEERAAIFHSVGFLSPDETDIEEEEGLLAVA